MKRRRRKILLTSLIVLVLALIYPVSKHYVLKWRVERYKRELRAQGEKLSVLEIIPSATNSATSGPKFLALAELLPFAPRDTLPTGLKFVAPGHARVTWACEFFANEQTTNFWPVLEARVAPNREVLAQLAGIMAREPLIFKVDFDRAQAEALAHQVRARTAGQLFCADALLSLHNHDPSNAQRNLENCLSILHRWHREPQMNAGMIRSAIATMALNATWESLQFPDWTDAQLARMQQTWRETQLLPDIEQTLALERVFRLQTIAGWREGFPRETVTPISERPVAEFMGHIKYIFNEPEMGFRLWWNRYPRYWGWRLWDSYEEELVLLKDWQATLDAVRDAQSRKSFTGLISRTPPSPPAPSPEGQASVSASLMDHNRVQRFLQRTAAIETGRNFALTAIALRRYQMKHGRFPANLTSLVPEFLADAPRDRMDDQPLRYRLNPDGTFLLYSVGNDQADNGGDPTAPELFRAENAASGNSGAGGPSERRSGLLDTRSVYGGRDWVWPIPATADEMRTYESGLAVSRDTRSTRPVQVQTNVVADLDHILMFFAEQFGLGSETKESGGK